MLNFYQGQKKKERDKTAWNDESKWWKFIHNDYFQE